MSRSVLMAALLVALGLTAASFLFSVRSSTDPPPEELRVVSIRPTPRRGFGAVREQPKPERPHANLERQAPVAGRAERLPERRHPQEPFRGGSEDVEARRDDAGARGPGPNGSAPPPAAGAAPSERPSSQGGVVVDYSQGALERALTEAGLPPAAAADVKRRYDELAMDEISLRNLATREGWIDSPHFAEELDEIEAERLAIRDEIGDDAYDHYLFATGQPNRVYVTDVMASSPAAAAGLQASDVIVRYGGAQILAPADLIAETEVGTQGETIRVQITRNGKPLELEVPRGPLGVRIGVTPGATVEIGSVDGRGGSGRGTVPRAAQRSTGCVRTSGDCRPLHPLESI